jgi:hypothetical protein
MRSPSTIIPSPWPSQGGGLLKFDGLSEKRWTGVEGAHLHDCGKG